MSALSSQWRRTVCRTWVGLSSCGSLACDCSDSVMGYFRRSCVSPLVLSVLELSRSDALAPGRPSWRRSQVFVRVAPPKCSWRTTQFKMLSCGGKCPSRRFSRTSQHWSWAEKCFLWVARCGALPIGKTNCSSSDAEPSLSRFPLNSNVH